MEKTIEYVALWHTSMKNGNYRSYSRRFTELADMKKFVEKYNDNRGFVMLIKEESWNEDNCLHINGLNAYRYFNNKWFIAPTCFGHVKWEPLENND